MSGKTLGRLNLVPLGYLQLKKKQIISRVVRFPHSSVHLHKITARRLGKAVDNDGGKVGAVVDGTSLRDVVILGQVLNARNLKNN